MGRLISVTYMRRLCYLHAPTLGFVPCVYTRTQIRLYMQAHRVGSDLSKSEFKRSEQ